MANTPQPKTWRDVLPIHPAADLFPPIPEAELKELAGDIEAHGLQTPVVVWNPSEDPDDEDRYLLLDGRSRLDALALLGLLYVDQHGVIHLNKSWNGKTWVAHETPFELLARHRDGGDPYALALSLNLHRRHLTTEQKRDLIAKLVKAKPEASNLQIAKQVKADDKTVAKVRRQLESTSEIPKLEKTVGKDGKARKQRAKRKPRSSADRAEARCAAQWKAFTEAEQKTRPSDDNEMPTEEEADESWQKDLYDQACLLVERMADSTRQIFFAHIKRKYLSAGDDLDIPPFLRREASK